MISKINHLISYIEFSIPINKLCTQASSLMEEVSFALLFSAPDVSKGDIYYNDVRYNSFPFCQKSQTKIDVTHLM